MFYVIWFNFSLFDLGWVDQITRDCIRKATCIHTTKQVLNITKFRMKWEESRKLRRLFSESFASYINQFNSFTLLVAALSLELIFKSILLAKGETIPPIHFLRKLCTQAEVEIDEDQKFTLDLLTEVLLWLGRYPLMFNSNRAKIVFSDFWPADTVKGLNWYSWWPKKKQRKNRSPILLCIEKCFFGEKTW